MVTNEWISDRISDDRFPESKWHQCLIELRDRRAADAAAVVWKGYAPVDMMTYPDDYGWADLRGVREINDIPIIATIREDAGRVEV